MERCDFLPLAIEYVFWEERFPEILLRFGELIQVDQSQASRTSARSWTELFEAKLQAAQDERAAFVADISVQHGA